MKKLTHVLTIMILPLLTLVLGLQLGMRVEERQLQNQYDSMEFMMHGGVGSGQLITNPEEEVDPALLWAVWKLMIAHYIHPEDMGTEKMIYGAAAGLVEAVGDPYSVFMTPGENKEFHQALNGKLQGIGAELTLRDGVTVVIAPLKGSPAAGAGLLPEDIILEVDGESIQGEPLFNVVQRIRGPKGTTVVLSIQRKADGSVDEVSIVRDEIKIPSVEYELKESASGSIAYIAVNQFADRTNTEVERALNELIQENPDGIVMDVRYNGGGYLDRAVDLASMFMRSGKVVSVARREGEPEPHYVSGRPIDTDTPLVILINEGSASASEILAGALQDHERATIIGKKSFGKGTIQEIFEIPGGTSLRVTIAKWLTPSGRDIGKEGIEPDIEVERTAEDMEEERDPQLERAMEWLLDVE